MASVHPEPFSGPYLQDDSIEGDLERIIQEKQVSRLAAWDIWYFRTRSRWSAELEQQIIDGHRQGNPPDVHTLGLEV